jgi:hypothetical protein
MTKNVMGTVSFDGLFTGMRKAQDFIVYPMKEATGKARIQSDKRAGFIDLITGLVFLSKGQYDFSNVAQVGQLSGEELLAFKSAIMAAASGRAGSRGVFSENQGALDVFAKNPASRVGHEARITRGPDGEFYALIVRIDRYGSENVIHGYKGRYFSTMKAAQTSIEKYMTKTNLSRKSNPSPRKKRDGRFNVWAGASMVNGKVVKGYNVEFLNDHIGWVKTKGEVDALIEQYNAKRLPNPTKRARRAVARKPNPTVARISHCVLQSHGSNEEAVCFTRSKEYANVIAGLMQKHAAPGAKFSVVEA